MHQIKEKTDAAVKAIEELGIALSDEALFGELAELNSPLEQEAAEQRAKADDLRRSHAELAPRVEAKARILAGKLDQATAEGRDDDAAARRKEGAELESKLQRILADAKSCEQRVAELSKQQQLNYHQVFEAEYPNIRESTVAVEIALVKLLDGTWTNLQRFGQESGLTVGYGPLVRMRHRADLTPYEHGPERMWLGKLREWFGGRV